MYAYIYIYIYTLIIRNIYIYTTRPSRADKSEGYIYIYKWIYYLYIYICVFMFSEMICYVSIFFTQIGVFNTSKLDLLYRRRFLIRMQSLKLNLNDLLNKSDLLSCLYMCLYNCSKTSGFSGPRTILDLFGRSGSPWGQIMFDIEGLELEDIAISWYFNAFNIFVILQNLKTEKTFDRLGRPGDHPESLRLGNIHI